MRYVFLTLMCLLAAASSAAERSIADFSDPAGDDFGDGTLAYPERSDIARGELDLLRLRLIEDDGAYWFEASFAAPVRDPKSARTGVGPEPVALAARRGFYNFNLDIYLDLDRKPGSGNTFTLPGRKARIDPAYAWEKAVVLTPRPEATRSELIDALMRQYPERREAEAAASVDQSILFATDVRTRGRSIRFRVPDAFLGNAKPDDMALTALVTGAKPHSSVSLGLFGGNRSPLEQLDLGVMQPAPGRPDTTFGHDGSGEALPIVDALLPSVDQQIALLGSGQPLTGRSWGLHAANEMQSAKRYDGMRRGREADAASGGSDPISALRGLFSFGGSQPDAPGGSAGRAPAPPVPVGELLSPRSGAVSPAPTLPVEKPEIATRLRTLQQLFDQKLIDETEFKQQKQRLLGEL